MINQWNSAYINFLRIISAELVLVGHATDIFFDRGFSIITPSHAVGVFFLLSGFLIAFSTVKKKERLGSYSFFDFFIDRFARIFSALVPCLLLQLVIDSINYGVFGMDLQHSFNLRVFIANLLMLQEYPLALHIKWFFMLDDGSFFNLRTFGSNLPLWTLAVEWWLYMFFGWLFLSRGSRFFWPLLLFFSIVPAYQALFSPRIEGISLIWFLGVAVFYMLAKANISIPAILDRSLSIALLALAMVSLVTNHIIIPLLLAGGWFFFTFRWFATKKREVHPGVQRAINVGADYSFTLYLVHYPILYLMAAMFPVMNIWTMWSGIVCINVISLGLAFFTEMRHKEVSRWIRSRRFVSNWTLSGATLRPQVVATETGQRLQAETGDGDRGTAESNRH